MKINFSKIVIPHNYVLVLPDTDFEQFQFAGQDSFFVADADAETVASHYSVRGKVYAVPQDLVFNMEKMRANRIPAPMGMPFDMVAFYFKSYFVENHDYKRSSVLYDTEMEVSVGDIVYFNYQEHYACHSEGRFIETDLGEMLLMRYDALVSTHPGGDVTQLKTLNGYVLVEPISVKDVFGSHIYEKSGIFLADLKSDDVKTKKKRNLGVVRHASGHCRNFFDFPEQEDAPFDFKGGELVLYNPKKAPSLEFSLHMAHFSGSRLVKLHRRDIFCVLPEEFTQEIPNIVSNVHLN